jgi:hypothetical protein
LGCLLYLGVATLYYLVIMVVTFKRLPKGNAGVGFSEIAFSLRLRVLLLYTLLSGLVTAGIVSAVRTFRPSWLAVPVTRRYRPERPACSERSRSKSLILREWGTMRTD